MALIDIHIGNQKFSVKSDVSETHLAEVAVLVQDKIDALLEEPNMTATKAAILTAVEFASQTLRDRRQVDDYRSTILEKAGDILDRIEKELTPSPAN